MLSESVVKFIVNETKKSCDPSIDRDGYIRELFKKSFEAVGLNIDDFGLPSDFTESIDKEIERYSTVSDPILLVDFRCLEYMLHFISKNMIQEDCYIIAPACDYDALEVIKDVSCLLEEGLQGVCSYFLGFLSDSKETERILTGKTVNQVRYVFDNRLPFDPIAAYQNFDEIKDIVRKNNIKGIEALVFESAEERYPFFWKLPEWGIESFSLNRLNTVFQISAKEYSWLFLFSPDTASSIKMVYQEDSDCQTVTVSEEEVYVNNTCSPIQFLDSYYKVETKNLGEIARIIRGSSIPKKELNEMVKGFWDREDAVIQNVKIKTVPGKDGVFQFVHEGECDYLDQSSLTKNGEIVPYPLLMIPEKLQKYVIHPEDGLVILVSRNGEVVADYMASAPTLISSNLFAIIPDSARISSQYLSCVMRSDYAKRKLRYLAQVDKQVPFLSKMDLFEFPVIFLEASLQEKVVERSDYISRRIQGTRSTLMLLEELDSFNPFQSTEEMCKKYHI